MLQARWGTVVVFGRWMGYEEKITVVYTEIISVSENFHTDNLEK